jgi:REP element-mobilizing transposase RayT
MKPNRRSIRLPGYDYASAGWYFVTICCKENRHLFGEIRDGQMVLNGAGELVEKWWNKIPDKFSDIELGEYQIMPNHFHAIVINVGADLCVGPTISDPRARLAGRRVGLQNQTKPIAYLHAGPFEIAEFPNQGEHMGSPLHRVIQWFKTMVTNEYIKNVKRQGWEPFENKIWQRNYYEHIIRNEHAFNKISDYIRNNPANWHEDEYLR